MLRGKKNSLMTNRSKTRSPNPDLESAIYADVQNDLSRLFLKKFGLCHLEDTSRGHFSDALKEKVPPNRDIIFSFLKRRKAFPDITGFCKRTPNPILFQFDEGIQFITVEIKREKIDLDHIYQAWKYADLFAAPYGLLISDQAFPDELKRLDRITHIISRSASRMIYCGQFNPVSKSIMPDRWYPTNPLR